MNGVIEGIRKRLCNVFGNKRVNNELLESSKHLELLNLKLSKSLDEEISKLEENLESTQQTYMQLILLREQLDLVKETQSNDVSKIIDNISKEIKNIMICAGIEVIEDEHIKFDESIHSIVDTIKIDDDTKVDLIAKSVCPGYRHKGKCLKEQKVIIYVAKTGGE